MSVSIGVALTTFGVVFPAELPDKTALVGLVLGTRYRPMYVLAGAAVAFALHVVLAVSAGSLLGLLPRRAVQAVVAVLFVGCAVLLLRGRHDAPLRPETRDAPTFWVVAWTSFAAILIAEFGDLTQIVTANLAAHYRDPLAVGAGSVLALWSVATLAILGGRGLLRVMPVNWITRTAAAAMLLLGGFSLVSAIHG